MGNLSLYIEKIKRKEKSEKLLWKFMVCTKCIVVLKWGKEMAHDTYRNNMQHKTSRFSLFA